MAVRLRLRRTGTKNKPCYRIVAADGRSPRDGRFIEVIGYYDPRHQDEKIDLKRAEYWIGHGAQPSNTVADIIKRAKDPSADSLKTPKKENTSAAETGENEASDAAKDESTETNDVENTPASEIESSSESQPANDESTSKPSEESDSPPKETAEVSG